MTLQVGHVFGVRRVPGSLSTFLVFADGIFDLDVQVSETRKSKNDSRSRLASFVRYKIVYPHFGLSPIV